MQRLSGSATDTGISVELVLWYGFTHMLLPLITTIALHKVVALKAPLAKAQGVLSVPSTLPASLL